MILDKLKELVEGECQKSKTITNIFPVWELHILPVVYYAKLLAKKLGADLEIVETAALLHDIGRLKIREEDHEITGTIEAGKILKKLKYPQNKINQVKDCIRSHRGSKNIKPKTLEAKIIANADVMAHYDIFPALVQVGLVKNNNDGKKTFWWLYHKIERNWQKKLTLPEARKMMRKKYQAIKIVLNSMKEYVK